MADPKKTTEALTVLLSIDATLKRLADLVAAALPKPVASARELDAPHGDPVVPFVPRDWTGPSYKDRHFSECPADFLEVLAEVYDHFAAKAAATGETYRDKPVAPQKARSARLARGWAKRVTDGYRRSTEPDADDWAAPPTAPDAAPAEETWAEPPAAAEDENPWATPDADIAPKDGEIPW